MPASKDFQSFGIKDCERMSVKKNILLVEDEASIAYALKLNLEAEGYAVSVSESGTEAQQMLTENYFDLLLLDVMLPDKNGYELCVDFREHDRLTPIIFLSALSDSDSRLNGLRIGADDFISKPFNLSELLLKIERLLFKSNPRSDNNVVTFGNNWIDFTTLEAKSSQGHKISMSKMEFELAQLLISNENKALSRDYIYGKIWGYDDDSLPSSRTLDNFIVFLRKYFEENPSQPKHFLSVRGVGYKFKL
jgi:two-component system alkaline phosphatase synthesis response regulator PhoP